MCGHGVTRGRSTGPANDRHARGCSRSLPEADGERTRSRPRTALAIDRTKFSCFERARCGRARLIGPGRDASAQGAPRSASNRLNFRNFDSQESAPPRHRPCGRTGMQRYLFKVASITRSSWVIQRCLSNPQSIVMHTARNRGKNIGTNQWPIALFLGILAWIFDRATHFCTLSIT